MEDEKKLYPFTLCSIRDEYPWGVDEFNLADLGYRDSLVHEGWLAGNSMSEIMDTYMDRVVGEQVFEFSGRQFPLQVKRIHVSGKMPLRVHPDAETAADRYDFLGREKLWYVAGAGKDAALMLGFAKDTDAGEFFSRLADGTVDRMLNIVRPAVGQSFHIAPGVPHAAMGDMDIIEISESSPLDFCLYNWGMDTGDEFDPELSLVEALDFIDFKSYGEPAATGERLAQLPEFCVTLHTLDESVRIENADWDSFVLFTCVKGGLSVQTDGSDGKRESYALGEGRTILVPAECGDLYLVPMERGTVLLQTWVPTSAPIDRYINPDAEPTLPEDNA